MDAPRLIDTHCHLGLMDHAEDTVAQLDATGLAVFDCGVDPRAFEAACDRSQRHAGIAAGVGLHPWWIADGRCGEAEVALLCDLAAHEQFIGEVGLDYSPRFKGSEDVQAAAFARLCATLASSPLPGRVISVHAVRAAGIVLDTLDAHDLLGRKDSPVIIFHWFSGTSDEFVRARKASCFFSVNERMLATKRGREYARQIPQEQFLLETDYPLAPGDSCTAKDLRASLERTVQQIAKMRQTGTLTLAEATTRNAGSLFRF